MMSTKKQSVRRARSRVLTEVKRRGYITNERAKEVGGWEQAWYHLNQMVEAGLLKRELYNRWTLRQRGDRFYQRARNNLLAS